MSEIDIKDVQAKIGEMLAAVERGQTLAIIRDGKAIAAAGAGASALAAALAEHGRF